MTGRVDTAALIAAVDDGFARQVAFLDDLVRFPSQRGEEHAAQSSWRLPIEADGYAVDMWRVDVEAIRDLPGFSPVAVSYDDAFNVVATHTAAKRDRPLADPQRPYRCRADRTARPLGRAIPTIRRSMMAGCMAAVPAT